MLEFYNTHIHPSSAQRAKAVIYLIAQTSPEEIAAKSDPEEQSAKLAKTLAGLLGQMGIESDAGKLQARLKPEEVAGGDTAAISAALGTYLTKDSGMPEEDANKMLQESAPVLQQVLPTLGIKLKGTGSPEQDDSASASTTSSEARLPELKEAVLIEDVRAFKASMPLSEGATPVKHLSEFEDLEPKL